MAEAEYAGVGAFLSSISSSLQGRQREQKRKHDQWMSCIMQPGMSAEDCTRILGYDPGEEARGGAESIAVGRRVGVEEERARKLETTIAGEERGVGYGIAKEERGVEYGIAKEERGEARAKRLAKYRAGLKTPKTPKLPTDWLKAPEKEESGIQKWATDWEEHIFTSFKKAGEVGSFEDLSEPEKQTHFNKWATRIPSKLRTKVREQVGMAVPTGKAPEGVTTLPPKLIEELREFDNYDGWYDSLSAADRGAITADEMRTIKAWFANR